MAALVEIILFIVLFTLFLVFTKKKWFIKIILFVSFIVIMILSFSISFSTESSFAIRQLFSKIDYQISEVVTQDQFDFCIYESPNHYYEIDVYQDFIGFSYYASKQFDFDYFVSDDLQVLYVFSFQQEDVVTLLIYLPSNLDENQLILNNQTLTKEGDYFFFETNDPLSSSTTFTIGTIQFHLPSN